MITMFNFEKSTNIKYRLELDCMDTQTGLSLSCSKKATFLHNATQMIKCHLNSLGSARYLSVNIEINCVSSAVYKKNLGHLKLSNNNPNNPLLLQDSFSLISLFLSLKAPLTTAADDSHKYFFIVFQGK